MLNTYYSGSLTKLLTTLYPQHSWLIWKFDRVPKDYWNNKTNQLKFMNWVESELNIKHWKDWYKISSDKIEGNKRLFYI